jgi:hypothetical protein
LPNETHRVRTSRHRRLRARHGDETLALDAATCANATDADGAKLYHKTRQGVTFPLADALCWLLAARQFILDVIELETKGAAKTRRWPADWPARWPSSPIFAMCRRPGPRAKWGASAPKSFTATTATPRGTTRAAAACYDAEELTALEGIIPGMDASARAYSDVAEPGEGIRPKPARA